MAWVFASLNQPDRTFEWLDKSCSEHEPGLFYAIRHPILDRFLPDSRYTAILKRMGLPPE
jgi:hypothetical protein